MLIHQRKSILPCALMLLAMCASSSPLWAQLTGDPAAIPVPDSTESDPDRAVVVSVTFNSPTSVVTDNVIISNRGASSAAGAPPLIRLELLDSHGNLLAQQDAWHPLAVRDLNEGGGESLEEEESGPGTFYIPFDEDISAVRIIDIRLDMELVTIDVSDAVAAFCAQNPSPAQCILFKNGFE
jgi:hypothetical protein